MLYVAIVVLDIVFVVVYNVVDIVTIRLVHGTKTTDVYRLIVNLVTFVIVYHVAFVHCI
jgi:hypothetical protein